MSGIGVNFLSRHLAMSQTPCVTHVIFCLGVYELGMPTMTLMFDFGYSYKIFNFFILSFFPAVFGVIPGERDGHSACGIGKH